MTDPIPNPPRPNPLSPTAQFMLNAAFHQHQQHDHLNPTPDNLPPPEPTTSQITFNDSSTEEVIRLDKEGFHYKGQFIADAGEAHRLMLAFLQQHAKVEQELPTEPPTDEELIAAFAAGIAAFPPQHLDAKHLSVVEYEVELEVRKARAVLERWGK